MSERPTLLKVLVTQRHWRKDAAFKVQFENAAKELAECEGDPRLRGISVSERQLQRWLSGQLRTQPFPDQCRVLEHMFGYPIGALLAPAPDHLETLENSSWRAGNSEPTSRPGITAVRRDRDNGLAGQPLSTEAERDGLAHPLVEWEAQVVMAARRALRFGLTAERTNVGPEMLDQLRDEVGRIAKAYPQAPLPTLISDLVELQDVAFRLLEGRQRPTQTRDLYLLAGVVCGMLAKASHDLGNPHAAMSQARTAYVCAENAGHIALQGWLRGLQSLIAYWAGWSHDAVRYAQLGGEIVTTVSGSSSVWLPALEARAWATLNNPTAAREASEHAESARDQLMPDDLDDLGGILTFPRPRQLYYTADALVWFSPEEDAERAATEAVDAYEHADAADWAFGDEAGARADLALARVRRGELEGAREALIPLLELPSPQRIHGVIASIRRVHEALRDPRHQSSQVACEVQEEIEIFCQAPLAALPR